MTKRRKAGKISAVVLLTLLIWVWADLSKTDTYAVGGATVDIAKSATSRLWVTFDEGQLVIELRKLVLRGSSSKIARLAREIKEEQLSKNFTLHPEEYGMISAGQYSLDVADFINNVERVKRLGLTVESAEPAKVLIHVRKLVKKSLDIICVDENGTLLKSKELEPRRVEMYVPVEWVLEKHSARVVLTETEIKQARSAAVESTPFVELPGGQVKKALTPVKVTLLKEPDKLENYTINMPTPGVLLSLPLQGKYVVEILNREDLTNAISIRATLAAKLAYENKDYHVILKIEDKDARSGEGQKEVIYNFPHEFLRTEEIELAQDPVQARFRMKPVSSD